MKENTSYLFLSRLVPKELEKEIRSKARNTMQDAANALQWNIIQGIEKNISNRMTLFNLLPISSYPKHYNDFNIKTSIFRHSPEAQDINLGFCNLQYVKQFMPCKSLEKQIVQWAHNNYESKRVIISYTLNNYFLKAISIAKNYDPSIVSCAIVADLPEYSDMSSNKNQMLRLYQKWNANHIKNKLSCVDSYVLLTKHMADYLKIDKKYIVIEGIATDNFEKVNVDRNDDSIIIFYAGTLHRKFGIVNLLDAFSLISNKDYRLIICGIGDSVDIVKKRIEQDPRITYFGQLHRCEVLNIMQKSTVLVNPRRNSEEYTKYSFPSKNLEFLSSGVPLVAYKLDGIPDEYDPYIQYVNGDSIQDLANKLVEVCEKSFNELLKIGNQGRVFVLKHKNAIIQTGKIIDMLNTL